MITFVLTALGLLLCFVVLDLRRKAAIRCLEQAERLRIRFSDLRHRLVMYAGSGDMSHDDRRAFQFLYDATTMMLRHPGYYHYFSSSICFALMDPKYDQPPALRKRDLSKRTRPLLKEYISAADDLVQQFADPIVLFAAYLNGESVIDCVRNIGQRRREIEAEKQLIADWRRAGMQALGATA